MKTLSPDIIKNDPQSTAFARGGRLQVLRQMARLTRKQFSDKYGISANTLQSWEAGKSGGLTVRGAERILPPLHAEGLFCTRDWLLHGVGQPPQLTNSQFQIPPEPPSLCPIASGDTLIQELITFRSLHTHTLDLIVNDEGMEPKYQKGDYVAGVRRTGEMIRYLEKQDCIVQTSNNQVLLRKILNNNSDLYDLVCINLESRASLPTLQAQTLICAAPIIWHRRPDIWPK